MGTRCLTVVMDGEDEIMLMYRQMDGYPTGHGQELKEFLDGIKICNGIGSEQSQGKWANGMGCLAAQIVAHFKTVIGRIYLYKPGTRDCWEYIYTVWANNQEISLEVTDPERNVLYKGLVKDFDPEKCEEES